MSFIMDMFGEFDGKRRFDTFDTFTVPAGTYYYTNDKGNKIYNKNNFTTTVGKWIFNIYFIQDLPSISNHIRFVNDDINKKTYGKIYDKLSFLLIEDKIDLEEYKKYLMKFQQFMPFVTILTPSYTDAMLTVTDEISKKKKELLAKNSDAVKNGDAATIEKISDELLAYAKELLDGDPSMDMYESGARGSFGNNFKNMFIMRGAVKDPDPTKGYNIITSNFIEGVSKEEYSKFANSLAEGPYSRSQKTSMGGYWEKLFMYAFGHVQLLDEGTDCGTKRYINFTITEKNKKSVMYNYIIEGSKLVELTSDNINKYIGKRVKMRFSSMCESKDGICSKCAGTLFYRLGIKNIGMLTTQVPSKLKVLSMKLFHDSQYTSIEVGKDIDPMKVFGLTD